MYIPVPVGLIAVFISLYLFKEYNCVQKTKREERRERINEHRQELLDKVLSQKNKLSSVLRLPLMPTRI
jgi:hypothetical protein